jgi:hypothetical protein
MDEPVTEAAIARYLEDFAVGQNFRSSDGRSIKTE